MGVPADVVGVKVGMHDEVDAVPVKPGRGEVVEERV